MKTLIFVPSNTFNVRGPKRLASKAGLFHFHAKGFSTPIKRRPAIVTERQRGATPAKVVCWTAVIGGPLFCPPTNVQHTHHAHRNQIPRQPPELPRTPDHPGTIAETRRRNGAAVTAVAPGFYSTKLGAFGARFQPIIYCNSVI